MLSLCTYRHGPLNSRGDRKTSKSRYADGRQKEQKRQSKSNNGGEFKSFILFLSFVSSAGAHRSILAQRGFVNI